MATPRHISPEVVAALASVLATGGDYAIPASRLRWAARFVCRDAHARNYQVESMLVELKPEWSMLLDSLHFPRGAERNEVTSHFIAFCIDEYFRLDSDEIDEGRDVADDETILNRFYTRGKIGPSLNEATRSHRV